MKFSSPAKVNLHLEILGRRADGTHEIQTLLQRVSLFDEIQIFLEGHEISLGVEGEEIPRGMGSLACRAAQAFLKEAQVSKGLRIEIKKRIPVAAGLGGGSSNAATVLMALNELLQTRWSSEQLIALGAKIGADIPLFIFQKPALGQGFGERLRAVTLPVPLWLLIVVPPFQISTAWAYAAYDRMEKGKKKPLKISDPLGSLTDLLPFLRNDLEMAAFSKHPEIAFIKEELLARGARGALMSGSGPVTFGLFPSKGETEKAEKNLKLPPGWKAVVAQGI